ncbi:MAG: DHA2 family efflux MFS transporter permease subunit [Alphaproteobacteria bacterium]|nr:DHA2 family efflux MFS transporter permease subunit [Alphaproteobacteria bacterium]
MSVETVDDLFARYGRAYVPLVMASGMVASFVMVVSSTIVNVAVPDVMGAFGIGQDQAQLMATAFNVSMTASQLLNAWVVAVLGQRYGFAAALAIYTVGSIIGGLSQDFNMIVFGRVLQGISSGIIQPLILVTIFQIFPQERRGFAAGIYSMALMLAVAMGPVFGGLAMEILDWRYIFFAPLPIIGIAFAAGMFVLPSDRKDSNRPFDWTGYGLMVVTLFCFMTGLTDGQREGWTSSYILGLFMTSVLAAVAFIYSQMRSSAPIMELSLFKNREFAWAMGVAFIFGLGNFAMAYAVPVFGQLVQGMTPLDAGLVLLPSGVVVVALLPFMGRMADRIKPHYAIIAGLLLFAIGTVPLADADVNTAFVAIAIYGIINRLGVSLTQPFIITVSLRTLPPDKLNSGAGTMNFIRQLGGSLGINAWVVFLEMRTH